MNEHSIEMEAEDLTKSVEPLAGPSTSSSPKLGMCEVCNAKAASYACPRCEVKTCSLKCSKIHKSELECNGERDKTKFLPLNKFTNLDLSSDYRLLEEITRNVETLKKNRFKMGRSYNPANKDLPNHLHKLLKASNERKTILKFLPKNFVRRKENTSYLHFSSNVIYWRIQWVFTNAENLKLVDAKVSESSKLSNLLGKYLVKQDDKVLQDRLQYYQAAALPGIKLLLKAEQKAGIKYFELDLLASLKDNLKNRTIIEFPTIYVVLKEHAGIYDVIDSDGEDNSNAKANITGSVVVNRIIKKCEKDDNLYSSLKNLLFISEYSEDDLSDLE